MAGFADLHIHTFYSDSSASPEEVIDNAQKAELRAIAITDHDTIDGIIPSQKAGEAHGIEVISGIELSSEMNNRDIHILGYCFDLQNSSLLKALDKMQDIRRERMRSMIEKLKQLGVNDIDFEEVCALAQSKAVGRPHLAQILLKKNKVTDLREAFNKYLAEGAPAYVSKFQQTPYEAIDLIRKAGGVSVLAHPMVTGVDELIPSMVHAGLGGLEVYYPNTSPTLRSFYEGIAKKHKLIMTGGSDSHGAARPHTYIGRVKVPYERIEELKEAAAR